MLDEVVIRGESTDVRFSWLATLVVLLALPYGSTAAASANAGEATRRVEITPFGGYQAGGAEISRFGQFAIESAPSYGVMVDVRVRPDATIQAVYDRQGSVLDVRDNDPLFPSRVRVDLSIEYFHLGGTLELGTSERLRPYFGLTVGATRFHPEVRDVGDEWRLSLGVGVGFKVPLSKRFGVRVDGRIWPTFLQTSGGFFCSAPGGCLVSVEGDLLTQVNATAGFFLAF